MAELRFTLVGEGASDSALVPVIGWLLEDLLPGVSLSGYCANDDDLPSVRNLAARIVESVKARSCHILFVHRDADTAGREARVNEVEIAVTAARTIMPMQIPVVAVIPIRMLEAWLVTSESAIRRAAGNPNGRMPLAVPRLRDLERRPNPKSDLEAAFRTASGLNTHRASRLKLNHLAVARATESFQPLRQLPAFQAFEADVQRVIREQGWPERLPA